MKDPTEPVLGAVCEHGSLARSCDRCERDAEIAALKASVLRLREVIERETKDHCPSAATGRPCKCFLCAALAQGEDHLHVAGIEDIDACRVCGGDVRGHPTQAKGGDGK